MLMRLTLSCPSVSTGKPFRFQYRIKRHDGVMRWCVCAGRSVKDAEGNVASWACSIVDVEDLVVAQQQSLRVKEHVNAVVAGAGERHLGKFWLTSWNSLNVFCSACSSPAPVD